MALNHTQIWTSININHISWLNYNHCRTLSHTNDAKASSPPASETEVRINQTSETCKDSAYRDRRSTSHKVAPRKFRPVSGKQESSTYLRRVRKEMGAPPRGEHEGRREYKRRRRWNGERQGVEERGPQRWHVVSWAWNHLSRRISGEKRPGSFSSLLHGF